MSFEALVWAVKSDVGGADKLVLLCLADHHNGETKDCYPSIERIALWCGMSRRTVQRALERLEAEGLVRRRKRSDGGLQRSTQYDLRGDNMTLQGCQNDTGGVSQWHPNQEENPETTKKVKRATQLPDGWEPGPKHVDLANNLRLNQEEFEREADKFRDHHAAKGSTFKDWNLAFNNWLRNAADYRRATHQGGRSPGAAGAGGGRSQAGSVAGAADRFLRRRSQVG